MARARLLHVHWHERGSVGTRSVFRQHQQQKLRGAPGYRRKDLSCQSTHRGRGRRHRAHNRRANAVVIMQPITTLSARAALLLLDDIDTDQIIPARFLTTTARSGLGAHLFADWRLDAAGEGGAPRADFALNRPEARGAGILVAGRNFGCGSSREHAPWALRDYGFRAIIAKSFADIFRANALKNGLLPVVIAEAQHARLVEQLRRAPERTVAVDLP